jgi:uncharacterized protein YprB with RNaseH-like and TPR domain
MDLRERLRMLKAAGASRTAAQTPTAPMMGADPVHTGPRPVLLAGLPDGYGRPCVSGEAFYFETRYPIKTYRGPLSYDYLLQVPLASWSLLSPLPEGLRIDQAVFLDTETTGLAGGSGTYAFLVGLGFFADEMFVVRQYFLRDYHEEGPMLEALEQELQRFRFLVTYNGKSFDWPLIETRFRMSRRRVPSIGSIHLDLLHPARRIWKERLGSCTLTNLERAVLGVEREGDVPGALIPELYFDYLRTGRTEPLMGVIEHNRLDLFTLAVLLGWVGHLLTDPLRPTPDGELAGPEDLLAVGRLLAHRGEAVRAITCLETAQSRCISALLRARINQELSRLYKRLGRFDEAAAVWEQMLTQPGKASLYAHVELAKFYEHVAHDFERASTLTNMALTLTERKGAWLQVFSRDPLYGQDALRHRLQRIHRKQERQG